VSLKSLSIPKKFYSGGKMRIAPIDIAHKNFSKKFMGFDSEEVIEFLREMADQMEELIRDRNSLKETLREKELNILEYRERDETLKATITTATKMAEQIRVDAEREAKLIMNDAQQKGEMIVKDARDSLKRIYQEVGEMKRARIQFEANLRSIAQAHLAMLDQNHARLHQSKYELGNVSATSTTAIYATTEYESGSNSKSYDDGCATQANSASKL
jgi:cell division initiation protein